MKMYSKEGQCMVDVRKVGVEDDKIVMTAKLMGAYSMKIYLTPEELREALKLLNWDLLSFMPGMLVSGTKSEDKLREIGSKIGASTNESLSLILGKNFSEKLTEVGSAVGVTTMQTLVESVLLLLQIVLENKGKDEE